MKRVNWSRRPLLIGVVHLPPIPGSLAYALKGEPVTPLQIKELTLFAVQEAMKYFESGFDGVIIENYGDKPFEKSVRRLAYASLALIVSKVVEETGGPIGVNVLRNDVEAAVEIAALTGAAFIRVNALCSAREAPEGRIGPALSAAAEALARVKASVDILADIDVKHSLPTVPNYTAEWEIAECAARKGLLPIKAIIITGKRTGEPPEPDYVAKLAHTAHRLGLKALVGSGVSPELIRLLRDAVDGFIVGSYVKAEGRTEAPVSRERATELARAAGKPV
jgi:hypothetical protein